MPIDIQHPPTLLKYEENMNEIPIKRLLLYSSISPTAREREIVESLKFICDKNQHKWDVHHWGFGSHF
jgi:hypothetical protein